uniref:Somatostatin/Cortistatin C-terminal domain-containing protein n=1 Tax=Echeneis naucrates TaxID=173247 RepID=A0A665V8K9_ECHNA
MKRLIYQLNTSSSVITNSSCTAGWLVAVLFELFFFLPPCTSSVLQREPGNIRGGLFSLLFEVEMLGFEVQVLLVALFSSALLDFDHSLLLKFMSELMTTRADQMLPELEEEEVGVRAQMMRRHLPLSQRERKAGCRNFFWKTFTSC